jgi:hypothetical protein
MYRSAYLVSSAKYGGMNSCMSFPRSVSSRSNRTALIINESQPYPARESSLAIKEVAKTGSFQRALGAANMGVLYVHGMAATECSDLNPAT